MTSGFIDGEKVNFPVAVLCRLLGVSTSGFNEWKSQSVPSDDLVGRRKTPPVELVAKPTAPGSVREVR